MALYRDGGGMRVASLLDDRRSPPGQVKRCENAGRHRRVIATMTNEEIQAFHPSGASGSSLEMGYLPHLQGNHLFPAVVLEIIRQLELLILQAAVMLGLLKRAGAWRHKVVPMG